MAQQGLDLQAARETIGALQSELQQAREGERRLRSALELVYKSIPAEFIGDALSPQSPAQEEPTSSADSKKE